MKCDFYKIICIKKLRRNCLKTFHANNLDVCLLQKSLENSLKRKEKLQISLLVYSLQHHNSRIKNSSENSPDRFTLKCNGIQRNSYLLINIFVRMHVDRNAHTWNSCMCMMKFVLNFFKKKPICNNVKTSEIMVCDGNRILCVPVWVIITVSVLCPIWSIFNIVVRAKMWNGSNNFIARQTDRHG